MAQRLRYESVGRIGTGVDFCRDGSSGCVEHGWTIDQCLVRRNVLYPINGYKAADGQKPEFYAAEYQRFSSSPGASFILGTKLDPNKRAPGRDPHRN